MARMDLDTAIRLSAEVKGGGNIDRVKKSLQDLGKSSQVSGRQIDKLYTETQKLSAASNGSVNALNQQKTALEALQRSVDPASRRFALLSQDIAKVSASLKEADAVAAGFSLASALTTSTAAASAGMVSFGGFTASTQSVAAALSRMGVSGRTASEMLRSLQGDTSGTVVTTQRLNQALNQAFASTPERAAAQISTMRQALAQLKIGSEDYLKTLVRVNEAEAVNQARSGRAAVIAASRAYAGPTMTSGYGSNERLPALPNTMAADMQRVSELTARVNNLDRATDEYRRSLQELEVVQRRLNAEPARRRLGLREAAGSAAGVFAMGGGPMGAIGAVGGSLAATGGAAGIAAAAGVAATAALTAQSVGAAKALEDQARRLRVMSENGDELQKQIISLTRNQGYLANSTEASAAAYDILQAGFSKNADILTILKAATLGAVGGFTDITTVADATTSILNGYGLSAGNAAMVVDQMKAATDDGKISMEAYAQSIGRVVPSAAAAKLPLEQVNAAISALTAQGVPVETTFSGINQLIKTVLKPTKEAAELAAELGLQFNAQALAAKGLGGFLADVAAKTGKSSDALSILFSDIDGYKAVVGLLNDDLQRFNRFTDAQANAIGRASRAAKIGVDPIEQYQNAWNDLASTLGSVVLPVLTKVTQGATWMIQKIMQGTEQLNKLAQDGYVFNPVTGEFQDVKSRMPTSNDRQRQDQRNSFIGPPAPQVFGPAVPARLQGTAAVPLTVVPANVQAAVAAATGGDKAAKDAEKAAKAAEAAGRKYEAEQIRMQARLAENQLQTNEGLQRNAIELDNQRYENSKSLALKQFEFDQSLQSRVLNLWSEGLLGPARAAAKVLSEFMLGFSENTARVADAQRAVNDARRALQQAETVHKQTLANMTERQRIEAMEARAGQVRSAGVGMGGQATFGSTGRVFNARGWVHGHFQNMNRDALIEDTVDVVMALLAQGVPTELGSNRQFRQGMTRAEVQSIVRQGIAAHKKYASGIGAIDVFVPEGTRVPLPLSSVANLGGAAGYSGNLPRGTQLMHLDPRSRAGTTGAPLLPVRDVSGEGNIQQARERYNQAKEELKLIEQQNDELRKFDRKELTQKLTQGLIDQNYELETSAQDLQLRNRLLMEGVRSEVIDGELQKADVYRKQAIEVAALKQGIDAMENEKDKAAVIAALEEMNDLYARQIELIDQSVAAQTQQGLALKLYIGELKRSLDEMQNIEQVTINVSKTIESELSSAMSGAVSAVITGSESVKQTLGNMFKNIGEAFVKMATDIIAKQIVMIALQSVLKALGGPSFGGFGSGPGQASPALGFDPSGFAGGTGIPFFANGGIMPPSGPLPLKAYSRGGVANSPQVALFGEGSMNEAYVPLPDGRRIPVALQAPDGNRGDRMRELMGASPAGSNTSPVLSMSFETTEINGVEYVSRDQLEAAMAETRKRAANDGAKQGFSMTVDKIEQSPGLRRKLRLP